MYERFIEDKTGKKHKTGEHDGGNTRGIRRRKGRHLQLGIVIDLNLLLTPRSRVSDVELQRDNGGKVSEAAERKKHKSKKGGWEGEKHAFMAPRSEGRRTEGLKRARAKGTRRGRVRLLKPETLIFVRLVTFSHYFAVHSFEVGNVHLFYIGEGDLVNLIQVVIKFEYQQKKFETSIYVFFKIKRGFGMVLSTCLLINILYSKLLQNFTNYD